MKILISSNAPYTPTGYGTMCNYLARWLRKEGHDVYIYAWYGLEGGSILWDDIRVLPRVGSQLGEDAPDVAIHLGVDLVIVIQDIWPLAPSYGERLLNAGIDCFVWFPVDGEPVPHRTVRFSDVVSESFVYSLHGQAMFKASDRDVYHMPCGVDPAIYKPGDKTAARKTLMLDNNRFYVLMVGANKSYPSRKGFFEALTAFGKAYKKHPELSLLLHTQLVPSNPVGGVDFRELVRLAGLPEGSYQFAPQMDMVLGLLPPSYMALLYQASDLLLAPSRGEGFGMPLLEAQACGTPVLGNRVASIPEVVLNGRTVKPYQETYSLVGQLHGVPDIRGFTKMLMRYWEFVKREDIAIAIHAQYDWNIIFTRVLKPVLEKYGR